MTINTIIVDDEKPARDELAFLLKSFPEINLIGQGKNGVEAVALIKEHLPDLVFLDLRMPGLSGVETLVRLNRVCPNVPVYIVTAFLGDFLAPLRALEDAGLDFNLARKPLSAGEIAAIARGRLGNHPVTSEGVHR